MKKMPIWARYVIGTAALGATAGIIIGSIAGYSANSALYSENDVNTDIDYSRTPPVSYFVNPVTTNPYAVANADFSRVKLVSSDFDVNAFYTGVTSSTDVQTKWENDISGDSITWARFNALYKQTFNNESPIQWVSVGPNVFKNNYIDAVSATAFHEYVVWFFKNVSWGPDIITMRAFNIEKNVVQNGNVITLGAHSNEQKENSQITFYPDSFFGSLPLYSTQTGASNSNDKLLYQVNNTFMKIDDVQTYLNDVNKMNAFANLKLETAPTDTTNSKVTFRSLQFANSFVGKEVYVYTAPGYASGTTTNTETNVSTTTYLADREYLLIADSSDAALVQAQAINSSATADQVALRKITQVATATALPATRVAEDYLNTSYLVLELDATDASLKHYTSAISKTATATSLYIGNNSFDDFTVHNISVLEQLEATYEASMINFRDLANVGQYKGDTVFFYKDGELERFFTDEEQAVNVLTSSFVSANMKSYLIQSITMENATLKLTIANTEDLTDTKNFEWDAKTTDTTQLNLIDDFARAIGYIRVVNPYTVRNARESIDTETNETIKDFVIYSQIYDGLIQRIEREFPHILKDLTGEHIVRTINDNGEMVFTVETGSYRGLSTTDRIAYLYALQATDPNFKGIGADFLRYVGTHEYGHHTTLQNLNDTAEASGSSLVGGISTRGGVNYSSYVNTDVFRMYLYARSNGLDFTNHDIDGIIAGDFTFFNYIDTNNENAVVNEDESMIYGTTSRTDVTALVENTKRRFLQTFEGLQQAATERGSTLSDLFLLNSLDYSSGTLNPGINGSAKYYEYVASTANLVSVTGISDGAYQIYHDESSNVFYKVEDSTIYFYVKDNVAYFRSATNSLQFVNDAGDVIVTQNGTLTLQTVPQFKLSSIDVAKTWLKTYNAYKEEVSITWNGSTPQVVEYEDDGVTVKSILMYYPNGNPVISTAIGSQISTSDKTIIANIQSNIANIVQTAYSNNGWNQSTSNFGWNLFSTSDAQQTYYVGKTTEKFVSYLESFNNINEYKVTPIIDDETRTLQNRIAYADDVASARITNPINYFVNTVMPNYASLSGTFNQGYYWNNWSGSFQMYDSVAEQDAATSINESVNYLPNVDNAIVADIQETEYNDYFIAPVVVKAANVVSNAIRRTAHTITTAQAAWPYRNDLGDVNTISVNGTEFPASEVSHTYFFDAFSVKSFTSINKFLEFASMDYSKVTYTIVDGVSTPTWDLDYVKTKFDLDVLMTAWKNNVVNIASAGVYTIAQVNAWTTDEQTAANQAMKLFATSIYALFLKSDKTNGWEVVGNMLNSASGLPSWSDSEYVAENPDKGNWEYNVDDLKTYFKARMVELGRSEDLVDQVDLADLNYFLGKVSFSILGTSINSGQTFAYISSSTHASDDVIAYNQTRFDTDISQFFTDYVYTIAEVLTRDYVQITYLPDQSNLNNLPDYLSGASESNTGYEYFIAPTATKIWTDFKVGYRNADATNGKSSLYGASLAFQTVDLNNNSSFVKENTDSLDNMLESKLAANSIGALGLSYLENTVNSLNGKALTGDSLTQSETLSTELATAEQTVTTNKATIDTIITSLQTKITNTRTSISNYSNQLNQAVAGTVTLTSEQRQEMVSNVINETANNQILISVAKSLATYKSSSALTTLLAVLELSNDLTTDQVSQINTAFTNIATAEAQITSLESQISALNVAQSTAQATYDKSFATVKGNLDQVLESNKAAIDTYLATAITALKENQEKLVSVNAQLEADISGSVVLTDSGRTAALIDAAKLTQTITLLIEAINALSNYTFSANLLNAEVIDSDQNIDINTLATAITATNTQLTYLNTIKVLKGTYAAAVTAVGTTYTANYVSAVVAAEATNANKYRVLNVGSDFNTSYANYNVSNNYFASVNSLNNGFFKDRWQKEIVDWQLYDDEGKSITDTTIRITEVNPTVSEVTNEDGTKTTTSTYETVTDRARAMWVYLLKSKGVGDRTVTGIYRNKETDSNVFWGFMEKDKASNVKYLAFKNKETGEIKYLNINFENTNNLFYFKQQADESTKVTLEDEGYVSWISDFAITAKYDNAFLIPDSEYEVYFADSNKAEIKDLLTLGSRTTITENGKTAVQSPTRLLNEDGKVIFKLIDQFNL